MKKQTPVAIRINPNLKKKSEDVFRQLGLNTHAGINMFLTQMALYQRIPFQAELSEEGMDIVNEEKSVALMIKADEEVKKKCSELAKNAGLNLSLVISMFLVQVVDKRAIPFQILSSEATECENEKAI